MTLPRRRQTFAKLSVTLLERRLTPVTNLILDFDGGNLQSGAGYTFQPEWLGVPMNPFTSVPTFGGSAANRTERIL